MGPAMCVLCGKQASRRIDLTYSDADAHAADGWTVQGLLRGAMLCIDCADTKPLGYVTAHAQSGVTIVRGCLVQCANNPPWHLRIVRTRMARPWRKVICPNCHGRASVQWLGAVVKVHHRFDWRGGFRQAVRVLTARQLHELEQQREEDTAGADELPDKYTTVIIGGGSSGDD